MMFATTISANGLLGFGLLFIIGTIIVGILCVLILPVFFVVALTQKKAEVFKRNRENIIVAQYDPPKGISPAEAGYLYDMDCGKKELEATLFDLERRHIIQIIDKNKILISDSQAYSVLKQYEKIAISVFYTGMNTNSSNNIQTKSVSLKDFNRSVKASIMQKGFSIKSKFFEVSKRVILFAVILSLWPVLVSLVAGINYNNTSYKPWTFGSLTSGIVMMLIADIFLTLFYIIAGYIMIKIWVKIAGEYWLGSRAVRAFWPELEGYRQFIKQTDLENIQYDAEQKDRAPIETTLPYAIALNLNTKWQQYISSKY
ncbi:MAG TPA: hypothetical protein VMR16_00875 [Candidatus Saccharimonadales bacterium]|nr:hypothetical protein [Candidatus Saccharimonadales bacterium]